MNEITKKQKQEREVEYNSNPFLPADLWQEIVKYLDQATILAARRVCKSFREHIGPNVHSWCIAPEKWKSYPIYERQKRLDKDTSEDSMSHTNLSHSLENPLTVTEWFLLRYFERPDIYSGIGYEDLTESASSNPYKETYLHAHLAYYLISSNFHNLNSLNVCLYGVHQLTWLSNLPHLHSLALEQSSRYGLAFSDILPLCYLKSLKTLKLDIKFQDSALPDLAKLTQIRTLTLYSNSVTTSSMLYISSLTELTSLRFDFFPKACWNSIGSLTKLTELIEERHGVPIFAVSLNKLSSLINLQSFQVSSTVICLSQGLQYISTLTKLRELSLYNFNYPLLRSLTSFEHLKKLEIELSKFSSVVFPEIKDISLNVETIAIHRFSQQDLNLLIAHFPNVKHLIIGKSKVEPFVDFEELRYLKDLKELTLYCSGMQSHDFSLATLTSLKFLRSLHIFSPPVKYVHHLYKMTDLETLSMENSVLSNSVKCELLSKLTSLSSLMINGVQYIGSLELLVNM